MHVTFLTPPDVRVRVGPDGSRIGASLQRRAGDGWEGVTGAIVEAAAHQILELAIPFAALGAHEGTRLELFISVHRDGLELERYPPHRPLEIRVPPHDYEARNWTA
jgi:hypothetical protein